MEIYYCQPQDGFRGKLIRSIDSFDKTYPFQECPAWSHKQKRTFIATSPIDFELNLYDLLNHDDEYVEVNEDDLSGPKPVIQLRFPMFFFWTYDKDIWIEQYDHPITSLTNNFIAVGAWWNLSRWVRNTNTAIVPVDMDYPIVIKKDDPLFRITFRSKDIGEDVILYERNEEDIPEDIMDMREEQFDIIDNTPGDLPKRIFKCPFAK